MRGKRLGLILCLFLMGWSLRAESLSESLVESDGDRQLVPFSQWLGDLTGKRSGIVYHENLWFDFSLPRSWKKGQSLDEVVKNAQLFSRRFVYEFTDEALTLKEVEDPDELPDLGYQAPRARIFEAGDLAITVGAHFNQYEPVVANPWFGYDEAILNPGFKSAQPAFCFDYFLSDQISLGLTLRISSYSAELKIHHDGSDWEWIDEQMVFLMLGGAWHLPVTSWLDLSAGLGWGINPAGNSRIVRSIHSDGTANRRLDSWTMLGFNFGLSLALSPDFLFSAGWLGTVYLDTFRFFEGLVNSISVGLTFRFNLGVL